MTLPKIESYTSEQIKTACEVSSPLALSMARADNLRDRAWCECVLATVHGKAPAHDICLYWSEVADQIIRSVAGELNPKNLAIFALGKLGSSELNLSSDVDLLCVAKEDSDENLKFLRRFQIPYRLDLDLRPGGRQGPLIATLDQFTDYYGNYGETWERLALIRLRPLWGPTDLIDSVLDFTKRFVFRRHLDFTLFDDLKALRTKIHAEAWQRSTENKWDLKLGVGGIRDLELFTHALQVVHGGKDNKLRLKETTAALETLIVAGLLPKNEGQFLISFYWRLRTLENLVQAKNDQQTHILPKNSSWPEPYTHWMETLNEDMKKCDQIVSDLLGKVPTKPVSLPPLYEACLSEMQTLPILSRHRERDLQIRNDFLLAFLNKLSQKKSAPESSLAILKEFLHATRAKSSFFSLLLSNESVLDILVEIISTSPYLSRIICQRPELLDSIFMRNMDSAPSADVSLDEFLDYLVERRLLTELLSGAELLRGKDLSVISENLTHAADLIATQLLEKIALDLAIPPKERNMTLLALGKWGGRELGLHSDLDCVFITENDPSEIQLKWARRFINRLTEAHRGGTLYTVDTRLKIAGKGGVILTSIQQLTTYLSHSAEAWERQAYLKSRWVNPNVPFKKKLTSYCLQRKITHEELLELERIRLELLKNAKHEMDLKYAEGGLLDTELAVQTLCLVLQIEPQSGDLQSMIQALTAQISRAPQLLANYQLMRQAEQQQRLLTAEALPERVSNALIRSTLEGQCLLLKDLDPRRQRR